MNALKIFKKNNVKEFKMYAQIYIFYFKSWYSRMSLHLLQTFGLNIFKLSFIKKSLL